MARATTVNTEAYETYIEGSQHLTEGTEMGFHNAVASFTRATTIDPNYALAYDGMAQPICRKRTTTLCPMTAWRAPARRG